VGCHLLLKYLSIIIINCPFICRYYSTSLAAHKFDRRQPDSARYGIAARLSRIGLVSPSSLGSRCILVDSA
jgi:hypothetical protein